MITLKNDDVNVIEYNGCIEGIQILSHVIANSANTPLAVQPKYSEATIVWRADDTEVYSGNLALFVQVMSMRKYLEEKGTYMNLLNLQFLNAKIAQIMKSAANAVLEEGQACLDVLFKPYYAKHYIEVRMGKVYGSDCSASSYLSVDVNPSDKIGLEKFKIERRPINVAGEFGCQIDGLTKFVGFIQSDNQFITTNDSQYGPSGARTSIHPVATCTISSDYSKAIIHGDEIQNRQLKSLTGILSLDTSGAPVVLKNATLMKSLQLSEFDFMKNPQINLTLNTASMDSANVSYSLVYDKIWFDVTSARAQMTTDNRLNPEKQAILNLLKGQF